MKKFEFLRTEVFTKTDSKGRLTWFVSHFNEEAGMDIADLDSDYLGKLEANYELKQARFIDNYSAEIYNNGTLNFVALGEDAGTGKAGPLEQWTALKLIEHLEYLARVHLRDFMFAHAGDSLEGLQSNKTRKANLLDELRIIEEAVTFLSDKRRDWGFKPVKKDAYLVYWALAKIVFDRADESVFRIFHTSVPELTDLQEHLQFLRITLTLTRKDAEDILLKLAQD